jgi:hypothetical protein
VPLEKDDDLKKMRKAIIFGFGGAHMQSRLEENKKKLRVWISGA